MLSILIKDQIVLCSLRIELAILNFQISSLEICGINPRSIYAETVGESVIYVYKTECPWFYSLLTLTYFNGSSQHFV